MLFFFQNGALSPALICPDSVTQCPDKNTCCKLKDVEGYACCPYPQAACCVDGITCCPHGYSCSGSNTCTKGDLTVPAIEQLLVTAPRLDKAAAPVQRIGDMCPDSENRCPSGDTCCLVDAEHYGCCPETNAVCCADGKHCCPNGYTCDLSKGTCEGYGSSVPLLRKRPAMGASTILDPSIQDSMNKPRNVMCDDKKTQCADGSTCCMLASKQYGCCPMANAKCCSDGVHCCPAAFTCNVSGEICSKGNVIMPLQKKVPPVAAPQNIICPDRESQCSSDSTCCLLKSGQYGCCPVPNAECCEDKEHCCPKGYACQPGSGTCTKGDEVIAMFKKQPAINAPQNNVVCPDQRSECSSTDTCCMLATGEYGCCPIPKALCCSDKEHCCPVGYTCDTKAGTCTKGDQIIAMFKKQPAINAPQNVICPDQKSECSSNNTCCLLKSGLYGCCPIPKAECCKDDVHCCPEGYACQTGKGTCTKGDKVIAMLKKQPALRKEKLHTLISKKPSLSSVGQPQVVVCADGTSICPDAYTCCRNASGGYSCCPSVDAVCCDDDKHCCPADYTCDLIIGKCVEGSTVLPLSKKLSATIAPQNNICPDEKSECASDDTCCMLKSGEYGCCPQESAVCCSDKIHCCPSGYTCNTGDGTCTKTGSIIPLLRKQPQTRTLRSPQIVCPNGQDDCSDNSTCCELASRGYGCCPVENALCCPDKQHCCPQGYACDTDSGTCTKQYFAITILESNRRSTLRRLKSVPCPDGRSECPTGNTCCKLASGEHGCCPQPNAVCCSDGKHCCPAGYTCDTGAGTCLKGKNLVRALLAELLPVPVPSAISEPQKFVCLGQTRYYCDIGQTCCKNTTGVEECCPIAHAVCCVGQNACCPSGYTCNKDSKNCIPRSKSSFLSIVKPQPLVPPTATPKKQEATPLVPTTKNLSTLHSPMIIPCPNGNYCNSGQTCCPIAGGNYACCPVSNAVCCSDYCCPPGSWCVGDKKCKLREGVIPMLKKRPSMRPPNALAIQATQNVICPDQESQCSSDSTCCKLKSGEYGCCPLPKALCCDDGEHCCPADYQCNAEAGTCMKGDQVPSAKSSYLSIMKPQPLVPPAATPKTQEAILLVPTTKISLTLRSPMYQRCPDGNYCDYTDTCCEIGGGEYGCCPYISGDCCSDLKHCCPAGSFCWSDGCLKPRGSMIPMLKKRPSISMLPPNALVIKDLQNVICPDQESQCSSDSTCCKLKSGVYGCCPVPNAKCCSDGEHCCPEGYACQTNKGTCTKGDEVIAMLEKQPAINSPQNIICPDQKSECSSNATCCLLTSGHYGCCPMANAVCCIDGKHCCPNDYSCDSKTGKCIDGDRIIAIFKKQPAIKARQNVVCPDQKSECSPDTTCCMLASGEYGCCPIPNAKCCSDDKHCCPATYECDTNAGTCTKGDQVIAMFKKQPAINAHLNVVCPDQKSECSPDTTCCKLKSGEYGCCPIPNAKCCSDDEHCCPATYECDTNAGTCTKGDEVIAMFKKQTAIKAPQNVVCPDQKSECSSNATCCVLRTGVYGCCPVPKAECCEDRVHCCPEGYTCQTNKGTCTKGDEVLAMFKKQPAINAPQNNVVCPDQKSECSPDTTCCLLKSGEYGCCPIPKALCCSDKEHCCPESYACNTKAGTCTKGSQVIAMFKKQPAINAPQNNIVCPDKRSECSSTDTCCMLKSGEYGCCPIPKALCCSDNVHCCPVGYTCDIGKQTCTKGDSVVKMLKKKPALNTPRNIICPDQESQCSADSTCCLLKSGQYGCCPVPKAKCCEDREHCCPEGYACQPGAGTCTKGDKVIEMLKKQPAINTPQNIVCPDKSSCPSKNTCCKLKSGQYGCCPQVNAVCCTDGEHCCPTGFTCQVSKGSCSKGGMVIPFLTKLPTAIAAPQEGVIKCPDNNFCPDKTTCCQLESGRYGCCPHVNASCCSDKEHCCPEGYTCQLTSNKCTKSNSVVPMLKKLPSFSTVQNAIVQKEHRVYEPQKVICPDKIFDCPNNNTCCLTAGAYRCCPGTNAVCCGDREHCCPEGFTCHIPTTKCTKDDTSVPMLKKLPSISNRKNIVDKPDPSKKEPHVSTPLNVICPDQSSQCPNMNTCCQIGDTKDYRCCPTPNAVCCPDKEHCCRKGYICNMVTKSCDDMERGVGVPFMESSEEAVSIAPKDDVIAMLRDVL